MTSLLLQTLSSTYNTSFQPLFLIDVELLQMSAQILIARINCEMFPDLVFLGQSCSNACGYFRQETLKSLNV